MQNWQIEWTEKEAKSNAQLKLQTPLLAECLGQYPAKRRTEYRVLICRLKCSQRKVIQAQTNHGAIAIAESDDLIHAA
jgi:hypothetical protein